MIVAVHVFMYLLIHVLVIQNEDHLEFTKTCFKSDIKYESSNVMVISRKRAVSFV